MLIRSLSLAAALLLFGPLAQAEPFYTDADRATVMERGAPNLRRVLTDDIIGNLPRAVRPQAAAIRLDFPIQSPSPLGFFADPATQTVYFPQNSIRFVDDIAILFAWFESQGCEPGMIQTYLWALLRDGQDLPSPLRAFRIDRDIALADPFTDDVSAKIYSSALQFVLAHEVGHLMLGHTGGMTGPASQAQEIEADAFAMDHFARLGAMPLGMTYYFVAAWWHDPVGDAVAASTHPVSPDRIAALADHIARDPLAFASADANPTQAAAVALDMASELSNIATLSV